VLKKGLSFSSSKESSLKEKKVTITCCHCQSQFATAGQLERHVSKLHSFQCRHCHELRPSEQVLRHHMAQCRAKQEGVNVSGTSEFL